MGNQWYTMEKQWYTTENEWRTTVKSVVHYCVISNFHCKPMVYIMKPVLNHLETSVFQCQTSGKPVSIAYILYPVRR